MTEHAALHHSVVSDSLQPHELQPHELQPSKASRFMEFSRQVYWSGLPFPSPGESSQPRDWTCSSFISRQILYHWASREVILKLIIIALHSFPVAYQTLSDVGERGEGLIFWCPLFLPFHTVHGILKARILGWFTIPFPSGPHFARTLHYNPSNLGGPAQHGS